MSKLVKVNKSGPNKGRKFYSCKKDRDQQCKFFMWAEVWILGQVVILYMMFSRSTVYHVHSYCVLFSSIFLCFTLAPFYSILFYSILFYLETPLTFYKNTTTISSTFHLIPFHSIQLNPIVHIKLFNTSRFFLIISFFLFSSGQSLSHRLDHRSYQCYCAERQGPWVRRGQARSGCALFFSKGNLLQYFELFCFLYCLG